MSGQVVTKTNQMVVGATSGSKKRGDSYMKRKYKKLLDKQKNIRAQKRAEKNPMAYLMGVKNASYRHLGIHSSPDINAKPGFEIMWKNVPVAGTPASSIAPPPKNP